MLSTDGPTACAKTCAALWYVGVNALRPSDERPVPQITSQGFEWAPS